MSAFRFNNCVSNAYEIIKSLTEKKLAVIGHAVPLWPIAFCVQLQYYHHLSITPFNLMQATIIIIPVT